MLRIILTCIIGFQLSACIVVTSRPHSGGQPSSATHHPETSPSPVNESRVSPSQPTGPAKRYAYYYYPDHQVYMDPKRRLYYYQVNNTWRRSSHLPPTVQLNRHRVTVMVSDKPPYTQYSVHARKFPPRRQHRTVHPRPAPVSAPRQAARHHYWYYPGAKVYFDIKEKHYFYAKGSRWIKTRHLPRRIHLNKAHRVKLIEGTAKPYEHHRLHARRHPPKSHGASSKQSRTRHNGPRHLEPAKQQTPDKKTQRAHSRQIHNRQIKSQSHAAAAEAAQAQQGNAHRSQSQRTRQQATQRAEQSRRQSQARAAATRRHQQQSRANQANAQEHKAGGPPRHVAKNQARTKRPNPPKQLRAKPYRFTYYPDAQVYFDPKKKVYFYQQNKKWRQARKLPRFIRLQRARKVNLNLATATPYQRHAEHKRKYPPRKK